MGRSAAHASTRRWTRLGVAVPSAAILRTRFGVRRLARRRGRPTGLSPPPERPSQSLGLGTDPAAAHLCRTRSVPRVSPRAQRRSAREAKALACPCSTALSSCHRVGSRPRRAASAARDWSSRTSTSRCAAAAKQAGGGRSSSGGDDGQGRPHSLVLMPKTLPAIRTVPWACRHSHPCTSSLPGCSNTPPKGACGLGCCRESLNWATHVIAAGSSRGASLALLKATSQPNVSEGRWSRVGRVGR